MGILDAPLIIDSRLRDAVDSAASVALQAFHTALANRDNAPCVYTGVGNSIDEGANATSREKRYLSRLRDGLRTRFPTSGLGAGGGFGFLAPYYIGTTMGQPYASLITGVPGTDTTFGWGRRAAKLSTTNRGYTYNVRGTAVDICYVQANAATSLTYTIDGGTAQTLSIPSGLADGKRQRVSLGASGDHTVRIEWASGTDVFFTGLMVYDGDENKGIHVVESGHWGWKTSDWTANASYWTQNFTAQPAHLVTIGLLENDFSNGVPSATTKANLKTMIAAIRARHTLSPSFVLRAGHLRGDVSSPAEPYANYLQAAYEVAAEDTGGPGGRSGVAVFDQTRRLPAPGSTGSGDPYGLIVSDRVHYSDKGAGLTAEGLLGFLSPR